LSTISDSEIGLLVKLAPRLDGYNKVWNLQSLNRISIFTNQMNDTRRYGYNLKS